MKSDANGYLEKWREHKKFWKDSGSHRPFGLGFGDDMNGFSSQPGPRDDAAENPLPYPFTSPVDKGVELDRQVSGQRVFDLNEDGIDHFGLYADWVADLEHVGGKRIIEDMAGATDAYLETWERAVGVQDRQCLRRRGRMRPGGYRKVGFKLNPVKLLKRAGQPEERPKRSYRYCVKGKSNKKAELAAVFTDCQEASRRADRKRRPHPPDPGHPSGRPGLAPGPRREAARRRRLRPEVAHQVAALRLRRGGRQDRVRRRRLPRGREEQEDPEALPAPRRPPLAPLTRRTPEVQMGPPSAEDGPIWREGTGGIPCPRRALEPGDSPGTSEIRPEADLRVGRTGLCIGRAGGGL